MPSRCYDERGKHNERHERRFTGATGSVQIEMPFEALVAAISGLSVEEKRRLLALLDDQLDDQLMEEEGGPEEEAAVAEARAQIEAGDYVTLDDYIAGKRTP